MYVKVWKFDELHSYLYQLLREQMPMYKVTVLKNALKLSVYGPKQGEGCVGGTPECADRDWGERALIGGAQEDVSREVQERFSGLLRNMRSAHILVEELGLGQPSVVALLIAFAIEHHAFKEDEVATTYGPEVAKIVSGLLKVSSLRGEQNSVESDNYVKLLLSMAQDIRVIFIVIVQHLQEMRDAEDAPKSVRLALSVEAQYLYAPLAHRLGFYNIKSELEDLSLKYTDRTRYDFIANKLNETKRSRDKYIAEFIAPVKERLDRTGLKYIIKGRTKSIHSINNKLRRQKIDFEDIYDLFAIRIILDAPLDKEKEQCWQVYSIVTDMYQPNPKRFRDWLSVPKSNGYESLHITVLGPQARWVEVQIRSQRMDDVAERGLAAHWKYKGLKQEEELDEWLQTLRESLDNKDANLTERLSDFKMNFYDEEIFVFSPKGDLFKLPKGASLLDFAFTIHTELGLTCVSGKVNSRNVPLRYRLHSGDVVEVIANAAQRPKQDWLNFTVTSKARTKIRQALKAEEGRHIEMAKEMLLRRLKNRKLELDDALLSRLIKKLKYKEVTSFYADIADGKLDVNDVISDYRQEIVDSQEWTLGKSANQYTFENEQQDVGNLPSSSSELIIDEHLTDVDYRLAKCCNPIFGDDIFGFVSSQGITIHRINCPNAPYLFSKYGYRVVKACWSKASDRRQYPVLLSVVGNDQIDIISHLMSVISKVDGVQMRSVNIDSNDGLFQGNIVVMLSNAAVLEQLIKLLQGIKGVKSVHRIS